MYLGEAMATAMMKVIGVAGGHSVRDDPAAIGWRRA